MSKRNFGELEFEVLQVLKSGKRMAVKEVYRILGEDKNKYTTIMTVLVRLAQKDVVKRERVGLHYEYWLSNPTEKVPSFLQHLKKKIFGVKTSQMVSYLIEAADDISDEDLADIEIIIEKAKMSRKQK